MPFRPIGSRRPRARANPIIRVGRGRAHADHVDAVVQIRHIPRASHQECVGVQRDIGRIEGSRGTACDHLKTVILVGLEGQTLPQGIHAEDDAGGSGQ